MCFPAELLSGGVKRLSGSQIITFEYMSLAYNIPLTSRLPDRREGFPETALFPFFTDHKIYRNVRNQGWWTVLDTFSDGHRRLTINVLSSRFCKDCADSAEVYDWKMVFDERKENVVEVAYNEISDSGNRALVGFQTENTATRWSSQEARVRSGMRLKFDTLGGGIQVLE